MKTVKMKSMKRHFQKTVIASSVSLLLSGNVYANPNGLSVAAGNASARAVGNLLEVTNSPGAILNWQQFNIGANETTRFIQENAASHVVNRVIGGDPSQILGSLQSNGHVFLINPTGIVFGQGAQVDTAGLLASTLNISDENLLNKNWQFAAGQAGAGALVNDGTLRSHSGGSIVLLAPQIENSGIIHSDGEVLLAAGHEVTIVDLKHPTIGLQVKAGNDQEAINLGRVVGENISVFASLLKNTGVVEATGAEVGQGGVIQFRGDQGIELSDTSVINVSGDQGGSIDITSGSGDLIVSGVIQADGERGQGGEIVLTGDRVALLSGTEVTANGLSGGGQVYVGGGWQGADPEIQNASQTIVQDDVVLSANALENGDGGEVAVWADELASVSSTIQAKGGTSSGNGGRVETSAKGRLVDVTPADTSAVNGVAGEWLLDPSNIVVLSPTRLAGIEGATAEALLPGEVDRFFFSDYSLAGAELGAVDTYITTTDLVSALNNNSLVRLNTFAQVEGNAIDAAGNISILDDVLISRSVQDTTTLLLEASGSVFFNSNVGFNNDIELGTVAGSNFVVNVYSQGDINFNGKMGINATGTQSSFGLDLTFDVDRSVRFNNFIDFGVAGLIEQPFVLNPYDDANIVASLGQTTGVSFNAVAGLNDATRNIDEIVVTNNASLDRELPSASAKGLNISVVGSRLNLGNLDDGSFPPLPTQAPPPIPVSVTVEQNQKGALGALTVDTLAVDSLLVGQGGTVNFAGGIQTASYARVIKGATGGVINVTKGDLFADSFTLDNSFTLNLGVADPVIAQSGSGFFGEVLVDGVINVAGDSSLFETEKLRLGGTLNIGAFEDNLSYAGVREFSMTPTGVVNIKSGGYLALGVNFLEFDFGTVNSLPSFVTSTEGVNTSTINLLGTQDFDLATGQGEFGLVETVLDISGIGSQLNGPLNVNVSGFGSEIYSEVGTRFSEVNTKTLLQVNQLEVVEVQAAPVLLIGEGVSINVSGPSLEQLDDERLASLKIAGIDPNFIEFFGRRSTNFFTDLDLRGSLTMDGGRTLLAGSIINLENSKGINLRNAELGVVGQFETADLAAIKRFNSDLFIRGFWDNSATTRGLLTSNPELNPLSQGSIYVADDATIFGGVLTSSIAGNGIVVEDDSLLILEDVSASNEFFLRPNGFMLVDTASSLEGARVEFFGDAGLVLETDSTGVRNFNDKVTFSTSSQGNSILAGFRTNDPFETQIPPAVMALNIGNRVTFEITGNSPPVDPLPGLVAFYGSEVPERSPFRVGILSEDLVAAVEYDSTLREPDISPIGQDILINGISDGETVLLGGDFIEGQDCFFDFCVGFDPLQGGVFNGMVVSNLGNSSLLATGIELSPIMNVGDINLVGKVVDENGQVQLNVDGGDFLFDPTVFTGVDNVIVNSNIRFPANVDVGFLPSVFVVNGQMIVETNLNIGKGFSLASSGTLLNSGNLVLNGVDANAIQGSIFNNGTIVLGQGQALNLSGNIGGTGLLRNQGQINFAPGASLSNTLNNAVGGTVNFAQGSYNFGSDLVNQGSANISGRLNFGSGGRLVQTQGNLLFRPSSELFGNLDLAGGSAKVFGTVFGNVNVGSAVFQPGNSPGLTMINGDLNLGPNSQTLIEFQGNGGVPGQDFDFIWVAGNANLNGALSLVDISALGSPGRGPNVNPNGNPLFAPQLFRFLEAASINGQFSSINRSVRSDAAYNFSGVSVVNDPEFMVQALEVKVQSSAPILDATTNPTNTGQEGDLERAYVGPEGGDATYQQQPPPPPEEEKQVNEEDEEAKRLAEQGSTTQPVSTQSEQLTVTSTRSNPIRPGDAECK